MTKPAGRMIHIRVPETMRVQIDQYRETLQKATYGHVSQEGTILSLLALALKERVKK